MRICLFLTVLLGLACAGAPGNTPEAHARAYLEAGTREDADATPFIDEGCADTPVGRFGPVRVFGVPVQLTQLDLTVTQEEEGAALVTYTYKGSLKGKDVKHERGGVKVEIGEVEVNEIERSGRLQLVRRDAGWRVACE